MENQNKSADGHLLHLAMMKGHDGKDLTSSAEGGSVRDQFSPGSEIGDRSGTKESESESFFFCVGKNLGKKQQEILNKWWVSSNTCAFTIINNKCSL